MVNPGGQLVIQQPANHDNITHRSIADLARSAAFEGYFGGWVRHSPVQKAELYGEWLHQAGGYGLVLIEKVYPHVLPDVDSVIEWVRGTALVPYLERLPAEVQPAFIAALRERLVDHYGPGEVFFGFRRMLLAANKPV
jgi:trans-aconitate 2-methyltransferase